jgi:hypothetical protein
VGAEAVLVLRSHWGFVGDEWGRDLGVLEYWRV